MQQHSENQYLTQLRSQRLQPSLPGVVASMTAIAQPEAISPLLLPEKKRRSALPWLVLQLAAR